MLKQFPIEKSLPWVLFGILAYFPLFLHLDSLSIRVWDESLYACNALEMLMNGNWIVKYLQGEPDMWNTKPPLVVWLQVLSFKTFGVNELAFRLPVALLSLATGYLLIFFSQKEYGKTLPGFLAACVLITMPGFVNEHVARTGDPDAPLTFFMLGTVLFFFRWLKLGTWKPLVAFTAFLICAALTKGISGLLFLPGMFLFGIFYGIQEGKPLYMFTKGGIYLAILAFAVFVGGFYLLRESVNPGYLYAVWENELGGRYLKTIEEHKEPFWFYWTQLLNFEATFWMIPVPVALVFMFFEPLKKYRKFGIFVFVLLISYFFVISGSETKLKWYVAPMLPLIAWLGGLVLMQILDGMSSWLKVGEGPPRWIFMTLFALMVLSRPYSMIIDKVYEPEDSWGPVQYGYFFEFKHKTDPDFKKFTIAELGRNHHNDFYMGYYNWKFDYDVHKVWYAEDLSPGEVVFSCDWHTIDRMHQLYWLEERESFNTCRVFKIISKK